MAGVDADPRRRNLRLVTLAREQRLYTYVDPHAVRSTHPGYCFTMAGWTPAGWTKGGHGRPPLLILQKYRRATSGQRGWQDGLVGPR